MSLVVPPFAPARFTTTNPRSARGFGARPTTGGDASRLELRQCSGGERCCERSRRGRPRRDGVTGGNGGAGVTGANGAPGGTGQITTRGAGDTISGAVATASDAVGVNAGQNAQILTSVVTGQPTGSSIIDSEAIAGTANATARGGGAGISATGGGTVSNSTAQGGNAGQGVSGGKGGAGGNAAINTTGASTTVVDSSATGGGTGTGTGFTGGNGANVTLNGPATGQHTTGAAGANNP